MNLWIRKISVILITFMTLGMYIPPNYLDAEAADNNEKEITSPDNNKHEDPVIPTEVDNHFEETNFSYESEDNLDNYFANLITEQAKNQTVSKLGPRIMEEVEVDFLSNILPNIEVVIKNILEEAGEKNTPYFGISDQLAPGYGEKIFNLYDYRTKEDIAKFHVRRDNRPGEGYWFNFHYHLSDDGFEEHHLIGEIYWDKNTPPKWMS